MNLLTNREAHVFIVNLGSYTDILSISIHKKKTHIGIWYLQRHIKVQEKHISLYEGQATPQNKALKIPSF